MWLRRAAIVFGELDGSSGEIQRRRGVSTRSRWRVSRRATPSISAHTSRDEEEKVQSPNSV
ncbi:hypothetical protein [Streptomyces sp. NPDC059708]|uniref:hypothetical protein n=1 Tax=Streptomyces sp. NPDC059708 TaxID=3346916 RepID=UPI003697AEB2